MSIAAKLRDLQEEVVSAGKAKMSLLEEIKSLKAELNIQRIEYEAESERSARLSEQLTLQTQREEERKK
ncbi:hypothetical protein Pmar_PMAR019010 [Perkinsus marinus ATCC 50983]|uniref:Uncharacterized protein n=1 Tax=Perkinsus marinus (strain ATCC 50983 / TXsc) TaxID=423536 RepID=C5KY26_PERM5|nr:hypothetical protein Pmar_PMAR019010 [Perkinsus marinus ATCC 50983]EER10633.1 hypothetical protein Pmar_PMAR019010 [Perkinsus marinus ATCC 50983]|eukprot:XP_002778838.1 hypothetical protein Pmar_PMAR019010 [Perkinsus marinus ATCC 50983]